MGVESYNKRQMERLADHKVAFDQEAMWAAMQKKKKRRGLIFFLTMALVALAIVFFSWVIYGWYTSDLPPTAADLSPVELSDANSIMQDDPSVTASSQEGTANVQDINAPFDTELNTNSMDPRGDISASQSDANTSIKNRGANTTTVNPDPANTDADPIPSTVNNKNQVYQERTSSSDRAVSQRISATSTDDNTIDNITKITSTPDNGEPSSESSKISNNSESSEEKDSAPSEKSGNNSSSNEINTLIEVPVLKFVWPFLESISDQGIDQKPVIKHTPIVAMISPVKSNKWMLGAYMGYGRPDRDVYLLVEDEESLLTLNDEVLEEVSAGIDVRYGISRHLYLSMGLDYWHVTDRRSSASSSVTNIKDVDGQSLGFAEGQTGIIVTTNREVRHTMYRTVNVPLLVGVEQKIGRWSAFAEAGVLMNVYTNSRGELPDLSSFGENLQIGRRSQLAPMINLGISTQVSDKVALYARGSWRASQHVTIDRSPIHQRYSAIRAQVGIRYGI